MSREVAAHGHDSSGLTGCQHPDGVLSGHRQAKEGQVEGPRLACRGALRAPFTPCSPSPVEVTPAALSISASRPPETAQPSPPPNQRLDQPNSRPKLCCRSVSHPFTEAGALGLTCLPLVSSSKYAMLFTYLCQTVKF